jgi:alpha-L-rhamnosidase
VRPADEHTSHRSDVQVEEVRIEHHRGALGIGESQPRLSWLLNAPDGWSQHAYEIEVADPDTGQAWSSGQITDADSNLRCWPADPLRSRDRRSVRVRVWGPGTEPPSPWSAPVTAEAGLLQAADWTARWISPPSAAPAAAASPAFLLRREFAVGKPVRRARAYATAHGVYDLELNGQRVGSQVLAPGWTSYHHRLRYQTYDVTGQLRDGANVIGAYLADGWFRGRIGFQGGVRNLYGDRTALLLQLEVEYEDGTAETIVTGAGWRTAPSPITSTDLYDGETYDALLERPGWCEPGYVAADWRPAEILAGEPANLVAPTGPPIRATQTLKPVSIRIKPSGRMLLDFGQNISGRLRMRVNGQAGDRVTLRHAEVLEDGELGTRPLRTARATDTYVLRGDDAERWEPRFTMHGFRYAEVSGWPGKIGQADIAAVVYHSDLERTGWFDSSDGLLNQLHENVVWSMRGNFADIPTDCPQRDERLGWTGDLTVFAPTAAFLFDCTGMLASWLADLAAEQQRLGTVPYYVPWVPQQVFPFAPAAVWGDATVLVPWALYQRTGDLALLHSQYPSMTSWADQVSKLAAESGLWDSGFQFGDWLDPSAPPDNPADSRTDKYLVSSAYHVHTLGIIAKVAALAGLTGDHERYSSLAGRARRAFAARFVRPSGQMTSDSQTAYALALQFGLLSSDRQRAGAGRRLAELVRAGGYRIGTGFVGTPLICDALTTAGYVDLAYRLLLQTDCPSWLYPVTMGATTIWERWDSMLPDGRINPGQMTSFNHYAFGAVADWLHRTVAGLAPAGPGYSTIAVRPRAGGGVHRAAIQYHTPYGIAEVAWERTDRTLNVSVTVPPGTSAIVALPSPDFTETVAGSGRHRFSCACRPAAEDPVQVLVADRTHPDGGTP